MWRYLSTFMTLYSTRLWCYHFSKIISNYISLVCMFQLNCLFKSMMCIFIKMKAKLCSTSNSLHFYQQLKLLQALNFESKISLMLLLVHTLRQNCATCVYRQSSAIVHWQGENKLLVMQTPIDKNLKSTVSCLGWKTWDVLPWTRVAQFGRVCLHFYLFRWRFFHSQTISLLYALTRAHTK